MAVYLHEEDLPEGVFAPGVDIAVDTETMGLITPRDRLCLVQLSDGGADEHLLKQAGVASKLVEFADMSHGWVPRGDITVPEVQRDVQLAMEEASAYFAELLPVTKESL